MRIAILSILVFPTLFAPLLGQNNISAYAYGGIYSYKYNNRLPFNVIRSFNHQTGQKWHMGGGLSYRALPHWNVSLDIEYDKSTSYQLTRDYLPNDYIIVGSNLYSIGGLLKFLLFKTPKTFNPFVGIGYSYVIVENKGKGKAIFENEGNESIKIMSLNGLNQQRWSIMTGINAKISKRIEVFLQCRYGRIFREGLSEEIHRVYIHYSNTSITREESLHTSGNRFYVNLGVSVKIFGTKKIIP